MSSYYELGAVQLFSDSVNLANIINDMFSSRLELLSLMILNNIIYNSFLFQYVCNTLPHTTKLRFFGISQK